MRKLIGLAIVALLAQYVVTGCAPAEDTSASGGSTTGQAEQPKTENGEGKKGGMAAPGVEADK